MRLWHEALIPYLPRQQLLGLHREVCALRGMGWGRKHATVDYVFRHPFGWLVAYHTKVMEEMVRRGYQAAPEWRGVCYRGKRCPELIYTSLHGLTVCKAMSLTGPIYPEHDAAYLQECLENLALKGIKIDMEEVTKG